MVVSLVRIARDFGSPLVRRALVFLVLLMAPLQWAAAGVNTGLVGDDVTAGPFPIGFTFQLYGNSYTNFYVTTNGLIQFTSPTTEYRNACLPSLQNTLFVFWDDLRTDVSGQPAGKIFYLTIGDAPNRKLVVQWNNQYFFGSNLPMGTFEAVLEEGTNKITYQYRFLTEAQSTGSSATLGVGGGSGQSTQFSCEQANAIHPEQAISFTPNGTTGYTVDANAAYNFIDISGLTPDAPTSSTGRYTKGPSVAWSWNQIPELNTYQIEVQKESGEIVVSQQLGNVTTYTQTTLEHNVTYLARVRGSVNGGATWEVWSPFSSLLTADLVAPTVNLASIAQSGPTNISVSYSSNDDGVGVQNVHLQLATNSDFQPPLEFDSDISPSGPYLFTTGVQGQHYYARVTSIDKAGNTSAVSDVKDVLLVPAPVAGFTTNISSGELPLNVAFTNQTTGVVSSYFWQFGNGQTSSAQNPNFTYRTAGDYTVTLRATGVGGQTETTQVIHVTPDVTPPALSALQLGGAPLTGTAHITAATALDFTTTDANGIQSVSGTFNGAPATFTNLGSGRYRLNIDPVPIPNGDYSLDLSILDIGGNTLAYSVPIQIDLPPPAAPVVTAPANGTRTNQAAVTVRGTGSQAISVQVYVNDVAATDWVNFTSPFQLPITLAEGANQITAAVRSIHGTSPKSAAVLVTLDTTMPAAITGLTGTAQASGKVRLTWTTPTDARIVGLNVYRSTQQFDSPSNAQKLNTSLLHTTTYDDLPNVDGTYYYAVVSQNDLGTQSLVGYTVRTVSDRTAPSASLEYTPLGKVDPNSGRIGQGRVDVALTVNEALLTAPYLAIVPQGGAPLPVDLQKVDDTHYTGFIVVDANTPSGATTALFSARDMVGNRGTAVTAGGSLNIDTDGPALTGITLAPSSPIKNDSAPAIQATFAYSKAIKSGQFPQIRYSLTSPSGSPVTVSGVTKVNDTTWHATFTLPAEAGLSGPSLLSFLSSAQDDLDNVSTKILTPNSFQVYRGELPPVDVPLAFTAKAQPAGKVKLGWQAVPEAALYQLYRKGPSDSALVAYQRTTGEAYIDQTPADGLYQYAIASVRQSNGQEAVSGQSLPVQVLASATAPAAPANLALVLTGQGIRASWQPPIASPVTTYNLYRSTGTEITSIEGLTPIRTGITQLITVDPSPSPTEHAYVVTALDAAGNESPISNSAYLNASLLPVATVTVAQIGTDLPVVSWTASRSSNVAGYNVYVGPESARVKLTPNPITALTFTDSGYTSGERQYTVAAVDSNGIEMPRSVSLPSLSMEVVSGLPVLRGVMNKLQVQITNLSANPVAGATVVVRIGNKDHKSDPVTLGPNSTQLVSVVVGGYTDLPAQAPMQFGVELVPNEGELVRVARNGTADVGDSALVVGIATEDFTRGATGKVRLTVENTSGVEVEILTALGNGNQDSSELRFKILDTDGNVLAAQPYRQVFGANVITLSSGQTVARIPAGASYTSDQFSLNVPGASPDNIRVRLEVDKLRYHTGQPTEVVIAGRGSERNVSLVDTAYFGEVTDVTPITSYGDQNVVITGRALDRQGSAPLPNTRLKLVLNQQGFERIFSVLTDSAGTFTYTLTPTLTDAGLYKVSAVHPDITDRPEQKAFTINRVTAGPTPYKLDVPKNYPFSIPFQVNAGPGTSASNVRLLLNAASQPTGQIPLGISAQLPTPVSLSERQTRGVPVMFTANNDAQPSGSLIFDVVSDEHAGTPLKQLRVDYTLSAAKPFLTSTPSFIETGMARGSSDVESVVVENKGLQDALDLAFTLTDSAGAPPPSWVAIASSANGTLPIGAKRSIDISFTPPAGVPEGVYEFKLAVQGENVPSQTLNVYASISQSGQGNVFFKAADIYTATVDKNGNLIAGLAGANITLQNEDVATITRELVTDSLGEALFQNIPAGSYKFRAKASNHQEVGGRLLVKPGITANQSLFLDYNLVTVEWSVREITIQDRYEITLNATYETDVPAAVVIMKPSSINLPKMNAGDVYYGELSLTNFGLIRADNVQQQLPRSDGFFRYEFLAEVPDSLDAKQHVTIPYRVVALASLEGGGTSSGGGCYSYSNSTNVNFDFVCKNGAKSSGSTASSWFSYSSSSCGTGSPGPGFPSGGSGGASPLVGGFGGPNGSTPIKLKGKKCVYVPKGGGSQCE